MQVQELFPGTVRCILCRGMVIYKDGDKTRFIAHLANEHGAFFDVDYLLASSMIENDQKASVAVAVAVPSNAGEKEASAEMKTTFKCDSCNTHFAAKTVYLQHVSKGCKKDIMKTRFNCEGCDKSYGTQQKLKVHIENVHLDTAIPKGIKQEVLIDQPDQGMGLMDVVGRAQSFVSLTHEDNFLETERIRNEDLTLNSTFDENATSTPNVQKFPCVLCNKKFQSNEGLNYHIATKHSSTDIDESSLNNSSASFNNISTSYNSSANFDNSYASFDNSTVSPNNSTHSLGNSSASFNSASTRLDNSSTSVKGNSNSLEKYGIDINKSAYFDKNPNVITKARDNSIQLFTETAIGLPESWRMRTLKGQDKRDHRHFMTAEHIVLKTGLAVLEFLKMEGKTKIERIMEVAKALKIKEKRVQNLLGASLPANNMAV